MASIQQLFDNWQGDAPISKKHNRSIHEATAVTGRKNRPDPKKHWRLEHAERTARPPDVTYEVPVRCVDSVAHCLAGVQGDVANYSLRACEEGIDAELPLYDGIRVQTVERPPQRE